MRERSPYKSFHSWPIYGPQIIPSLDHFGQSVSHWSWQWLWLGRNLPWVWKKDSRSNPTKKQLRRKLRPWSPLWWTFILGCTLSLMVYTLMASQPWSPLKPAPRPLHTTPTVTPVCPHVHLYVNISIYIDTYIWVGACIHTYIYMRF